MITIEDPKKKGKHHKHPKAPPTPVQTVPDLTGLWTYAQVPALDDRLAKQQGHVDDTGAAAPHGTYVPVQYYIVRMSTLPKTGTAPAVTNGILDVFDEAGNFCRFSWDAAKSRWASSSDPIPYAFAGDPNATPPQPADSFQRYPTLVMDYYTKDTRPNDDTALNPYLRSAGDGTQQQPNYPAQAITYTPGDPRKGTDHFNWYTLTATGDLGTDSILFSREFPQQGIPPGPGIQPFGAIFVVNSELSQLDFMYYSFDPAHMDVYTITGQQSGSGTGAGLQSPSHPGNPGANLPGPLIFNYPTPDSYDYLSNPNLSYQPNLPLGVFGRGIGIGSGQTLTEMLTSVADHMRSWSASLGFSGGLAGLLSAGLDSSFSTKVTQQTKQESRFTVQRDLTQFWVCHPHRPSLTLTDDFRGRFVTALNVLLSGGQPDWKNFVRDYGTHYLHAMTQGTMLFSETRFTLQAQATASEKNINIKENSKLTLEKVGSGKSSADIAAAWSSELGSTVSQEDVSYYSIGSEKTAGDGIFFDLRPMTELLSPIFFPYNPDNVDQKMAPWVWYRLRDSFNAYLESIGMNQPLDPSLSIASDPRLVKVTLSNVSVTVNDHRWNPDNSNAGFYIDGSVSFTNTTMNNDDAAGAAAQFALKTTNYNPDMVSVAGDGPKPGENDCSLQVVVGKTTPVSFTLSVDLYMYPGNEPWEKKNTGDAFAHFVGTQAFTCDVKNPTETAAMTPITVQTHPAFGEVDYTLNITVQYQDTGSLQYPAPATLSLSEETHA